jgi:hypothetical protein
MQIRGHEIVGFAFSLVLPHHSREGFVLSGVLSTLFGCSSRDAALDMLRAALLRGHEYVQFRGGSREVSDDTAAVRPLSPEKAGRSVDLTPEEQIDASDALITASLRADLLQRVLAAPPEFLEQVILRPTRGHALRRRSRRRCPSRRHRPPQP